MIKDADKRKEGTVALVVDYLNDTPGQNPISYLEWLKKNKSQSDCRVPLNKLTTPQRMRKVDEEKVEESSNTPLNVRVSGIDTYRNIIDAHINGKLYRYYIDNHDTTETFKKARDLSWKRPKSAIDLLKRRSTKVIKEEIGVEMEYAQYKGYIPSIFNKCAPVKNWDISNIIDSRILSEQFDGEDVIIIEYKNTPFRISNGIMSYYDNDSNIARQFVRELIEEVKKKKRKNKVVLNPEKEDLPIYEKYFIRRDDL